MEDFYEFLQISPSAELETIHRVYRFLAARLHPDNQETGDAQGFFLLTKAYEVLSDPIQRAAYDASRNASPEQPLSTWIDFMDNLEGELNRRLAYWPFCIRGDVQRRTSPKSRSAISRSDLASPAITWISRRGICAPRASLRDPTMPSSQLPPKEWTSSRCSGRAHPSSIGC